MSFKIYIYLSSKCKLLFIIYSLSLSLFFCLFDCTFLNNCSISNCVFVIPVNILEELCSLILFIGLLFITLFLGIHITISRETVLILFILYHTFLVFVKKRSRKSLLLITSLTYLTRTHNAANISFI